MSPEREKEGISFLELCLDPLKEERAKAEIDAFARRSLDTQKRWDKYGGKRGSDYNGIDLKYLAGERAGKHWLLLFPEGTNHSDFHHTLAKCRPSWQVRSAGTAKCYFGEETARRLLGTSLSLQNAHILDPRDSTRYRQEVLKTILGEIFEID